MKEITNSVKQQVVKLFLSGSSYDEIAMQTGIAKGSVVNIINQFREGELHIPLGMTGYIDELRQVAVDMKKYGTNVGQLKTYTKIHEKVKGCGVDTDQLTHWLDISQDIATSTVSNNQFVSAALQLAELTATTGKDYKSVIADYKSKLAAIEELGGKIEQAEANLADIEEKTAKKQEQAVVELATITKAITTAQETFSQQKKDLKAQLDEYMDQNKLSWETAKKAVAVIESGLSNAGLNHEQIAEISERIAKAGSLTLYIKDAEKKEVALVASLNELIQQKNSVASAVKHDKEIRQQLADKILKMKLNINALDIGVNANREKLGQLEEIVSSYGNDLYAAGIILSFLHEPECLDDYNFDQLVELMLGIRRKRLGLDPTWVVDSKGKVVCQCFAPKFAIPVSEYGISMEEARQRLALYLVPLVEDKFVSKLEYNAKQFSDSVADINDKLLDIQLAHLRLPY